MKLFKSSGHGQELIIGASVIAIIIGFILLKQYNQRLFIPGQNACMADCSQVNGSFRRYNHNIMSVDQCICLVNDEIRNIWN